MGENVGDGTSDVINVSTSESSSAPHGTVDVNLTGDNLLASGESDSVAIFTTSQSISFSTANLSVEDSSTVDYELSVGNDGSHENITLTYTVDYAPASANLSTNQRSVGKYISQLAKATRGANANDDSPAFVKSLAHHLLAVQTHDELKQIYDLLGPGEIFATAQTTVLSSLRFDNKLHSVPKVGDNGIAIFWDEGSGVWADVYGAFSNRGDEPESAGYSENTYGVAAGMQYRFGSDWVVGGAFSYERSYLWANNYSGNGHRLQAGIVGKKIIGATTISGTFSGGFGAYEATRTLFNPTGSSPSQADSSPNNGWIAAHARIEHRFTPLKWLQVQPSLDVGVCQFWQGAYSESGSNPFALEIDSYSKTNVTMNPMVEVMTNFNLGGIELATSVRAGVLGFLTDRDISTNARLQGTGTAGPWFTLSDTDDRIYGQVGAEISGQITDHITVQVGFDSLLGGNSSEYVGTAKLNFTF